MTHQPRPRLFPYAGIPRLAARRAVFGLIAFAMPGVESAAAEDCFLIFCRERPSPYYYDRPGPYDRPNYDRPTQYERPNPYNGPGQYDRPGSYYGQPGQYERPALYDRPAPYERPPYARPEDPREPQRQRDLQWQRDMQGQEEPQREPEWQARPNWQEPAPDPYRPPEAYSPGEQPYSGVLDPYARIYGLRGNETYPVPALRLSDVDPVYLRRTVHFPTDEAPGTIVIDPHRHFLYFVEGGGRAVRYGVGVGRTGFGWSGVATVHRKASWPDWYPPREMIQRQPEIKAKMSDLQGGIGMPGGLGNPLGARALYLFQGNKDTLYRIHGTVEPWTIGRNVSSGCIRMINQDVIDLYERAPVGAKVVVLSTREAAAWQ
jgi:lipoprotein-anchoring transpeptidase ErfK/SrfK